MVGGQGPGKTAAAKTLQQGLPFPSARRGQRRTGQSGERRQEDTVRGPSVHKERWIMKLHWSLERSTLTITDPPTSRKKGGPQLLKTKNSSHLHGRQRKLRSVKSPSSAPLESSKGHLPHPFPSIPDLQAQFYTKIHRVHTIVKFGTKNDRRISGESFP